MPRRLSAVGRWIYLFDLKLLASRHIFRYLDMCLDLDMRLSSLLES